METKRFQFKADAEQPQAEAGVFSGYGAVFGNIDDGGDIIEPGAFDETLKDYSRVKVMLQHNLENLPLGKPIELGVDEHGLRIVALISATSTGLDVRVLIRDRVLTELSIGYEIPPGGFYIDDNDIRHLTKINLLEISVVTWAMNELATISDYKALGATLLEVKEGRKISGKRLQSLKDARDVINEIIEWAEGEKSKARQPPIVPAPKRRSNPALAISRKNIQIEITI